MRLPLIAAAGTALLASACQDTDTPAEQPAEPAAAQPTAEPVALGLTEAQLLDADLVRPDGTELGEVEAVLRDSTGTVDRLLVEVEDTDPDRFAEIPIESLSAVSDGDDKDVATEMTRDDLTSLPQVDPASVS